MSDVTNVDESKYYELLKLEYSLINDQIAKINLGFNSIQNILFMLFTGTIAILISTSNNEVLSDQTSFININHIFLMLPYLIFAFYYHILKYTIKVYKLAGYKQSIEFELNKIAGKYALIFEAFGISQSHYHKITGGLYVGFLGLASSMLTIYLGFKASISLYGTSRLGFYIVNGLYLLNLLYFVFLIFVLATVANNTYKRSKEHLGHIYSAENESNTSQTRLNISSIESEEKCS